MITEQCRVLWLFIILWSFPVKAQIQNEYEMHLQSINASGFSVQFDEGDSVNAAKALVNYTASHLLEKPSDKYFIANRNLLEPLDIERCDTLLVKISDTLKNGKPVEISVGLGAFIEKDHVLRKSADTTMIYKIDNQVPYGAAYKVPEHEIANVTVRIGDKSLPVPKNAYSNFYRPNMCHLNKFFRGIEAYESLNGEYIYLYFFGGTMGDVWFAKLVFDHEKYITRIISDHYVLDLHDSFREEFIGF